MGTHNNIETSEFSIYKEKIASCGQFCFVSIFALQNCKGFNAKQSLKTEAMHERPS